MSEKPKKPGFFQKLFGSSKTEDDSPSSPKSTGGSSSNSGQKDKKSPTKPSTSTSRQNSQNAPASPTKESSGASKTVPTVRVDPPAKDKPQAKPRPKADGGASGAAEPKRKSGRAKKSSRRKGNRKAAGVTNVDANQPLEFPATPELILTHHKLRPFLNKNEEWLLVELNEFECLVDNINIIKTIAKHSKFFEVEPDELWEEFFEYVEEMPSYDEVINFDVWQEFRDEKYPC